MFLIIEAWVDIGACSSQSEVDPSPAKTSFMRHVNEAHAAHEQAMPRTTNSLLPLFFFGGQFSEVKLCVWD